MSLRGLGSAADQDGDQRWEGAGFEVSVRNVRFGLGRYYVIWYWVDTQKVVICCIGEIECESTYWDSIL